MYIKEDLNQHFFLKRYLKTTKTIDQVAQELEEILKIEELEENNDLSLTLKNDISPDRASDCQSEILIPNEISIIGLLIITILLCFASTMIFSFLVRGIFYLIN